MLLQVFFSQGKPTEASAEAKIKDYGQVEAKNYIPGAEVLELENKKESNEEEGQFLSKNMTCEGHNIINK